MAATHPTAPPAGAEESAILRAVLESPFDDTPRLVYADWLEEHGQPERAEFCRVQCALAPLLAEWGEPKSKRASEMTERQRELHRLFVPLQVRERELWVGLRHRYLDEFLPGTSRSLTINAPDPNPTAPQGVVRRGFVEAVTCTIADWCGGPCGRCNPDGRGPVNLLTEPGGRCPDCQGTGERPALGPAVVRLQPVVDVRVVDVRAAGLESRGVARQAGGVVWLFLAGPEAPAWVLNAANAGGPHPNRGAAADRLSRVLVDWARAGAGLTELTGFPPPG